MRLTLPSGFPPNERGELKHLKSAAPRARSLSPFTGEQNWRLFLRKVIGQTTRPRALNFTHFQCVLGILTQSTLLASKLQLPTVSGRGSPRVFSRVVRSLGSLQFLNMFFNQLGPRLPAAFRRCSLLKPGFPGLGGRIQNAVHSPSHFPRRAMSAARARRTEPFPTGSALHGDSGRVYKIQEILSQRRQPLLCVYRAKYVLHAPAQVMG
jgi:hypothetical protein